MATVSYTVRRGDSLWSIAKTQLGDATKWPLIAKKNRLTSPYTIHPNQVLDIGVDTTPTQTTSEPYMPSDVFISYTAGSTTEVIAGWNFTRANTAKYKLVWYWWNNIDQRFSDTSEITVDTLLPAEDFRQTTYSIPSTAIRIAFKVLPISTTQTVNNVETNVWTAGWSTLVDFDVTASNIPVPSEPTVPTITSNILTASLSNIAPGAVSLTRVEFQIFRDNGNYVFNSEPLYSSISSSGYASISYTVTPGHKYTVRARYWSNSHSGGWSQFSSEATSPPGTPESITKAIAVPGPSGASTDITVELAWSSVYNAEHYTIQYAEKNVPASSAQTVDVNPEVSGGVPPTTYKFIRDTLTLGREYWFRVQAVNSAGSSNWTEAVYVKVGTTPSAPTTWSSTTKVTIDSNDNVILYWMQNSEDGSEMTTTKLSITYYYYVGSQETSNTVEYTIVAYVDTDGKRKIRWNGSSIALSVLEVNDSVYSCKLNGSIFQTSGNDDIRIGWKVRTAGVTATLGAYSVTRTVYVYEKPALSVNLLQQSGGSWVSTSTITSFPFRISLSATPVTQTPISYHVEIISKDSYETVDNVGNVKMVNANDAIFVRDIDLSTLSYLELSADAVTLENNQEYKVLATVAMNSGLTASNSTIEFKVAWVNETYSPDAVIGVDTETLSAYIRPSCLREVTKLSAEIEVSNRNGAHTVWSLDPTQSYRIFYDATNCGFQARNSNNVKVAQVTTDGIGKTVVVTGAITCYFYPIATEGVYADAYSFENLLITDANDPTVNYMVRPEDITVTSGGTGTPVLDTGMEYVSNVSLSVYRREFDGKFTEIASGISNTENTYVIDPHPALDYARYRIVAKNSNTGRVNYRDIPGYLVNEKSVVIQWAENWTDFDVTDDGPTEENPWTGSMLRLPYNIDVSSSYSPDKTMVQYAGREHPVAYYGTQLGETQTWNVEIVKSDKETLYALRRLAVWMNDVYVREPSGSGYWATIEVSFNQNHTELTIPVAINVTRVEGGM